MDAHTGALAFSGKSQAGVSSPFAQQRRLLPQERLSIPRSLGGEVGGEDLSGLQQITPQMVSPQLLAGLQAGGNSQKFASFRAFGILGTHGPP